MLKMKSGVSLEKRFGKAIGAAVFEMKLQAVDLVIAAQALAPIDTGALKSSAGIAMDPSTSGTDRIGMEVFFGQDAVLNPKTGKPTSEYAMHQHEPEPTSYHPFYLSAPTAALRPVMVANIAKAFFKGLKS